MGSYRAGTNNNDVLYSDGYSREITGYGKYGDIVYVPRGTWGTQWFDDYQTSVYGYAGNDTIYGHYKDDSLYGGDDDDYIYGRGGFDYIEGGRGNDKIYGDEGNDRLYGDDDEDRIEGGIGDDYIEGGSGTDIIHGGSGDDRIYGSWSGESGNSNFDYIYGEDGNDWIQGSSLGWDHIRGGRDNDTIYGLGGNDNIGGDEGSDYIEGGNGDDYIEGGSSNDIIYGGYGADTFVFKSSSEGTDTIKDFNFGEGDRIQYEFEINDYSQFSYNSSTGALSFNGQTLAILENKPSQVFLQSSVGVEIFEHGDFQGKSWKLRPGRYNIDFLSSVFGNDVLSSLKVPTGYQVILYEHANFTGQAKMFGQYSGWVGNDFNDKTSSIEVKLEESKRITKVNLNAQDEILKALINQNSNYNTEQQYYGYKWSENWPAITYSFFDGGNDANLDSSESNAKEIPETIKNVIRNIIKDYINPFIKVKMIEVSDQGGYYGEIRYATVSMLNGDGRFGHTHTLGAYNNNGVGDVHLYEKDWIKNNIAPQPGSFEWYGILHETLHALGLKHPGNYNGTSTGKGPFLPDQDDNPTNTIMSYNFVKPGGNRDNPSDYVKLAATPMPYDIKALQFLYGADTTHNDKSNTYKFTTVDRFTIDGRDFWGNGNPSTSLKQTIWDGGGIDTLDFSALSQESSGYRFDLIEGGLLTSFSAINRDQYQLARDPSKIFNTTALGTVIAYGVTIENVIGSSSNDTIIGNNANNTLNGGLGNDNLTGGLGADNFVIDYISGSSAVDTIKDFNGQQEDRIVIKGLGLTEYAYFDTSNSRLYKQSWLDPFGFSRQDLAILDGFNASNPFNVSQYVQYG